MGAAPLSPPHPDFVIAMGRTNDAIIYGGRVHLFVTGPASDARELADEALVEPVVGRDIRNHDLQQVVDITAHAIDADGVAPPGPATTQ